MNCESVFLVWFGFPGGNLFVVIRATAGSPVDYRRTVRHFAVWKKHIQLKSFLDGFAPSVLV